MQTSRISGGTACSSSLLWTFLQTHPRTSLSFRVSRVAWLQLLLPSRPPRSAGPCLSPLRHRLAAGPRGAQPQGAVSPSPAPLSEIPTPRTCIPQRKTSTERACSPQQFRFERSARTQTVAGGMNSYTAAAGPLTCRREALESPRAGYQNSPRLKQHYLSQQSAAKLPVVP